MMISLPLRNTQHPGLGLGLGYLTLTLTLSLAPLLARLFALLFLVFGLAVGSE